MSRTYLTAPLTVSCGPSDAAGVWAMLAADYDLAGQPVTIQAAAGTYTAPIRCDGPLVGQQSPGQVQFIGDPSNPANCLLRPTSGDPLSVAFGAQLVVSGFKGVQANSSSPGEGTLTVGGDSLVVLGRVGDACAFIFGDVVNQVVGQSQFNDMTANGGGKLWLAPGLVKWVTSAGAIRQCMFDIGDAGSLLFLTNGGVDALLTLEADNTPVVQQGIYRLGELSRGVLGCVYAGLVYGQQWWVQGNSILTTYNAPGVMFGTAAGNPAIGLTYLGGQVYQY